MQPTTMLRTSARTVVAVLILASATLLGAPTSVAATPKTTITVQVTNCGGCTISAQNFRTARFYGERVVRNGKVVFTIASGATKGLGFLVRSPRPDADYSAQYLAVARYAGKRADQSVTVGYAAAARKGAQCWAGTARRSTTLKLRVTYFRTTAIDGSTAYAPRAFFTTSLASIGTPWATYRGSLATQSVINCSGNYPG